MSTLKFKGVNKIYEGGVKAVKDLDLTIDDGEFAVIVGPSGCGKSTTLRMIAGLEEVSYGDLYIDDTRVNDVSPSKRNIAMVFQNYALYPHKTIYENMAFGLRMAKVKTDEIDRRVKAAAEILDLSDYLTRKPKALSGGQRQRAALGRAIVREPKIFLLDEPLSNLDAKLRVNMRSEITKIHAKLGTTFVYVTHDQVEAMTMGTLIVVIKDGVVQQVDTPKALYDHPDNLFVALFLGTPNMNTYLGKITREEGDTFTFEGNGLKVTFPEGYCKYLAYESLFDEEVRLGIRPEHISLKLDDKGNAQIDFVENLGGEMLVHLILESGVTMVTRIPTDTAFMNGGRVTFSFEASDAHLFSNTTSLNVLKVTERNMVKAVYKDDHVSSAIYERDISELSEHHLPGFIYEDTHFVFSTKSLHLDKRENDIEIPAKIASISEIGKDKLIYLEVSGIDHYLVAKTREDSLKENEDVVFYLSPNEIDIISSDGTRMLAKHTVTNNEAIFSAKKKGNKTVLNNGPFSLMVDPLEDGKYKVRIPYGAFSRLEKDDKTKENVVELHFDNEDDMGSFTMLYGNLPSFPDYLSVKARKNDSCFSSKKMAFKVDVSKIAIEKII